MHKSVTDLYLIEMVRCVCACLWCCEYKNRAVHWESALCDETTITMHQCHLIAMWFQLTVCAYVTTWIHKMHSNAIYTIWFCNAKLDENKDSKEKSNKHSIQFYSHFFLTFFLAEVINVILMLLNLTMCNECLLIGFDEIIM